LKKTSLMFVLMTGFILAVNLSATAHFVCKRCIGKNHFCKSSAKQQKIFRFVGWSKASNQCQFADKASFVGLIF